MDRIWHKTNSRNVNDLGGHKAFKKSASLVLNAFVKFLWVFWGGFYIVSKLGIKIFVILFSKKNVISKIP